MRGRHIAVLMSAIVLAGCGVAPETITPAATTTSSPVSEDVSTPLEKHTVSDPVKQVFDSLTLDQKIGQLIMVSLTRTQAASNLRPLLEGGQVTGVLLLDNGWTADEVAGAVEQLNTMDAGQPVGLYIAVDQEGGNVQRLSGKGFDAIPKATVQGSWSTDELTAKAESWAKQLSAIGVNLNLAPDTDTVPASMTRANKPIGALGRYFSTDPAVVGSHARAFIAGMSAGDVQTCIKHFPGLGRITGNTDTSAKGITDDVTTSQDDYVAAFKDAMAADPAMVMMSLATYSKIDADHPAAFSSAVVDDLLRGQLGWGGVVISDALNAAAVKSVPAPQRATQFIQAGGDIALFPAIADATAGFDGIKALVATNKDFAAKVDAAVMRVLRAKAAAGLLDNG